VATAEAEAVTRVSKAVSEWMAIHQLLVAVRYIDTLREMVTARATRSSTCRTKRAAF